MTEKPVTTGVFDTSDELPERADMPRIMDERNGYQVVTVERADGLTDVFVDGSQMAIIDTRTRAQLDDGCVTGCSCNGSTGAR